MDSPALEAVKFAGSTVTQILTLSTALLTLSVTFAKDYLLPRKGAVGGPLGTAWVCLVAAILSGAWTLMALTGEIGGAAPSIWNANVRIPSFLMSVFFCIAIAALACAGWAAVRSERRPADLPHDDYPPGGPTVGADVS